MRQADGRIPGVTMNGTSIEQETHAVNRMKGMLQRFSNRRSFLKHGIAAAGAATAGTVLMGRGLSAFGGRPEDDRFIRDDHGPDNRTRGHIAILRLLAAAEIIEADLWQQYNELGGVDAASSGYTAGLLQLDGDMPQYISDITDD